VQAGRGTQQATLRFAGLHLRSAKVTALLTCSLFSCGFNDRRASGGRPLSLHDKPPSPLSEKPARTGKLSDAVSTPAHLTRKPSGIGTATPGAASARNAIPDATASSAATFSWSALTPLLRKNASPPDRPLIGSAQAPFRFAARFGVFKLLQLSPSRCSLFAAALTAVPVFAASNSASTAFSTFCQCFRSMVPM
jgi:hypothetical protein